MAFADRRRATAEDCGIVPVALAGAQAPGFTGFQFTIDSRRHSAMLCDGGAVVDASAARFIVFSRLLPCRSLIPAAVKNAGDQQS